MSLRDRLAALHARLAPWFIGIYHSWTMRVATALYFAPDVLAAVQSNWPTIAAVLPAQLAWLAGAGPKYIAFLMFLLRLRTTKPLTERAP